MRILEVIRSADPAGGGPIEGIRQHAIHRRQLGHATTIVSLDAEEDQPTLAGVELVTLGPGTGTFGYRSGVIEGLRKLAADHDLAIVNGLWQYHGLAAHAAFRGRCPYLVLPHGMLGQWFNRRYPAKRLKKRLYWPLGDYRLLRDAGAVAFTSEGERLEARTAFRPYAAREAVVGYGIDNPPTPDADAIRAFRKACGLAASDAYLLFLSRIHPVKGCDLLIRAFARIAEHRPDLQLVMAGPDSVGLAPGLRALAHRLGIAHRLRWPGLLTRSDKWSAFAGAEAFVLPSHHESFGLAVVEALASGCPVLISDRVAIHREIATADAGLVGCDTIAGVQRLLRTWVATAPVRKHEMGLHARHCFQHHFHIERSVRRLLAVAEAVRDGQRPLAFRRRGHL